MAIMLTLGKLRLDAPFYQAGLAGYSDAAMRMVARRHGCPYCITEAMLDRFLLTGGKGLASAELSDDDHPIAGQLMGSEPGDLAAAARVLVGLGYDVVDINLACPVKKVKRKARGGHLLSTPDHAVAILRAVRDAVGGDVPLTVKLRRSFDETPEMTAAFHRVFEAVLDEGYAGATVHSRTVQQKYLGPGKWAALRDIADRYGLSRPDSISDTPDIRHPTPDSRFTLGGSGDIWRAEDVFRMLRETGVHWVSVARGCIGNPWLFAQARAIMAGDAPLPPTIAQQRGVLLQHFELSVQLHGEHAASRMMRKFGIKFARHHPEHDAIKAAFIAVRSLADWRAVLDEYYTHDGPGVGVDDALPDEAEYVTCHEPIGAGG